MRLHSEAAVQTLQRKLKANMSGLSAADRRLQLDSSRVTSLYNECTLTCQNAAVMEHLLINLIAWPLVCMLSVDMGWGALHESCILFAPRFDLNQDHAAYIFQLSSGVSR